MNANEKIYIKYFFCESTEDDYGNGQTGNPSSSWDDKSMGFSKDVGYPTIEDALKAVCEANCFKWNKRDWVTWYRDYGEYPGRFNGCFMVDVDNSQATESEIESWKRKELRLWCCDVHVQLEVRAVRDMTADEAMNF